MDRFFVGDAVKLTKKKTAELPIGSIGIIYDIDDSAYWTAFFYNDDKYPFTIDLHRGEFELSKAPMYQRLKIMNLDEMAECLGFCLRRPAEEAKEWLTREI